ncbi:MAG: ClpXP protease specificity-enhancing factor SspB [Holophagales bacterium]|nr:ClpXP protease specificity-enhancing factor SspB [Holophagales bacterium]
MSRSPDSLDYHGLLQDALRSIVRRALEQVASTGLPGTHHFYISFATDAPGVGISEELRNKYPEHMTIVLQYDFRDLDVDEKGFSVTLRFGGVPQRISVPFRSLVSFYDPSEQFALRFESARAPGAGGGSGDSPSASEMAAADAESSTQESPRPPVRAVLAAADRMAAEKAAEAREAEDDDSETSGGSGSHEGTGRGEEHRARRPGAAGKGARATPERAYPDTAASNVPSSPVVEAGGEASEKGAEPSTSAPDEEEGGDDGPGGGVVISFEDFRRR